MVDALALQGPGRDGPGGDAVGVDVAEDVDMPRPLHAFGSLGREPLHGGLWATGVHKSTKGGRGRGARPVPEYIAYF